MESAIEDPPGRPTTGPSSHHQVERWKGVARDLGFVDFLSPADGFRACEGRRAWANAGRSGLYFWLSSNGDAYIGQSVRPRSRLRQHMKVHGDIVLAAFQRCPTARLDAIEAELVCRASEHFPLRNIKLAISTATPVPFDRIVKPEEQVAFAAGDQLWQGERQDLAELERLHARRYERFLELPNAPAALEALNLFVGRAIPKPAATERLFWSVTLQPERKLIRVNAGHQEVFTVELAPCVPLVRVLTDSRVSWLRSGRMPYQTRSFENRMKAPRLERWLSDTRLGSCRRLIIQLMRHTQALNSGSHCPQALRGAWRELCPVAQPFSR